MTLIKRFRTGQGGVPLCPQGACSPEGKPSLISIPATPASRFSAPPHASHRRHHRQREAGSPLGLRPCRKAGALRTSAPAPAAGDQRRLRTSSAAPAGLAALLALHGAAASAHPLFSNVQFIYRELNSPTGLGEGQRNVSSPLGGSVPAPQVPFD